MIEIASTLLEHMTATISKRGYGERKVLIYITAGVILFFKPLVTRRYSLAIEFSPFALFWIVVLGLFMYLLRKQNDFDISDRLTKKIVFMTLSPALGHFIWWLSNIFVPAPNMISFIDKVNQTSRLSWLSFMCQWENIVPSLYFIFYFTSFAYLFLMPFRSIAYLSISSRDFVMEMSFDSMVQQSIIMVFLIRSNIAYRATSYLFSLLE